jgi:hypothetical protein
MQLINQLANLKSKIGKCFGITFSTKRSEIRAPSRNWFDTEKNLLDTQTIGIRHRAHCPNRHDLIVLFLLGLLTSLRFFARNGRTCGSSSTYDFVVLVRPMMASFRKICVNFVQNWHYTNPSISLFCRVRFLIIYILHNNICLMCLISFLCLLVYYVYLYY